MKPWYFVVENMAKKDKKGSTSPLPRALLVSAALGWVE